MSEELALLAVTAASVGLAHTVLGPDHYIPFVVMGRAGGWCRSKTIWVVLLCGLGHVLSSVLIGSIGIALGLAVTHLGVFESWRGNLAGWALVAFGLVYFLWGLRRALRGQAHSHGHLHEDGGRHDHPHDHQAAHLHPHENEARPSLTPWILFTVFFLGPCEPLIPLMMYAAARTSWSGVAMVAGVFSLTTCLLYTSPSPRD